MKGAFLSLFFFFVALHLDADIIRHPYFTARSTNRVTIDSIDFRSNLTRFYLTCKDREGGWILFSKEIVLQDNKTGKKWKAIDIEGADFNIRTIFTESETMPISLDFPPMAEHSFSADLIEVDPINPWRIIDISMDGKRKAPTYPIPTTLLGNWCDADGNWLYGFYDSILVTDNQLWYYQQIESKKGTGLKLTAKNKQGQTKVVILDSIQSGHYTVDNNRVYPIANTRRKIANPSKKVTTTSQKSSIKGFLQGYHPRIGFQTGKLFADNVITKERKEITVTLDSCGYFELSLDLCYPVQQTLYFPTGYINFYAEPGDDLFIYVQMEQLFVSNTTLNDAERLQSNTCYMGKNGRLNHELKEVRTCADFEIQPLAEEIKNRPFDEYAVRQKEVCQQRIDKAYKLPLSVLAKRLVYLHEMYDYACRLLEYERVSRTENSSFVATPDMYQFLKGMPLDDYLSLSAPSYRLFIGALEVTSPFRNYAPTAEQLSNEFKRLSVNLTPEELALMTPCDLTAPNKTCCTLPMQERNERLAQFNQRYKEEQTTVRERLLLIHKKKVWNNLFGLKPSLTFELLFCRQFSPRYQFMQRALTDNEFNEYTQYIRNPLFKNTVYTLNQSYRLQ